MMGLTTGRIVHVKSDRNECKPAIVVQVWKDMQGEGRDGFNGVLFRDGTNDRGDCFDDGIEFHDPLTRWVTSVVPGDGAHEWHDPRECGAAAA